MYFFYEYYQIFMTIHFILIYIYLQKQIKIQGSFYRDLSNKNSMKYNIFFLFRSNNIMCVFNYKTNNWNASKIYILIRIKFYIRYLLTQT